MKKLWLLLVCGMIFAGCGAEQTMETVADEPAVQVSAEPREIYVALPDDSVLPAMESDSGTVYFCKDYDISIQTMGSGDLKKTVESVSGYSPENLTIMETVLSDYVRYDFVWSAAGELGQQVCRASILDDGNYHYVLAVMGNADTAGEYGEIWNGILDSFCLV